MANTESRENVMLNVYYCCMDSYLTIVISKFLGVVLEFFQCQHQVVGEQGTRQGPKFS